jgi:bifunctional ADP-heptose synthase (sugar kinase/adenylyltransferase)
MEMEEASKTELIVTIVVKGGNLFGEALCEAHGVWQDGRKVKRIDYSGPISGAKVLYETLQDVFAA